MTDFISLEDAINSSVSPYMIGDGGGGGGGGQDSSLASWGLHGGGGPAHSPLGKLLNDLRRKHAAAAGPQVGGGVSLGAVEYAILPIAATAGGGLLAYGTDVDLEDIARRITEEENDRSYAAADPTTCHFCRPRRRHPALPSTLRSSTTSRSPPDHVGYGSLVTQGGGGLGTRITGEGKSSVRDDSKRPSGVDVQKVDDDICPVCRDKRRFDPLGEVYNRMGASFLHMAASNNARYTGGSGSIGSSSHEENLLRSTPHLRHLCAASTDMQGAGNLSTSRNFLSRVLPSSQQSGSGSGMPIEVSVASTASSSKRGKGSSSYGAASMIDYRTCVARNQANRRTALELASFLRVLAHEMSLEEYGSVENEVFTSIFALVHSADNADRLAGVAALDALIGVPSADEEKKAIKFANNLSNGLRVNNGDYEFLAAVSRALGRMAMGASNVDYVEFEVTRALEWLRTERSDRRLAASLTLKELARNAPTAFYSKTSHTTVGHGGSNEFLDQIFPVLRDPQPIVRVCAADALSECLKILMERKQRSTTGLLCQIYADMMEGLGFQRAKKRSGGGDSTSGGQTSSAATSRAEAACHGSLLVVGEMLKYTGDFMLPRFDEVCRAVLSFADHSKALIRLEVVRLIPRLARRCPSVFGRRYLEDSLNFLIESARNAPPPRVGVDIRPAAFSAIGQLACAMSGGRDKVTGGTTISRARSLSEEEDSFQSSRAFPATNTEVFNTKLDEIFALVQGGLQKSRPAASSRGGGTGADTRCEALLCGADLVEALGDEASPYISDLLDDMFGSGLSEDLIRSLHAVSVCLPAEQPVIENRLLQELSLCLAGTPSFRTICDPLAASKNRFAGIKDGPKSTSAKATASAALSRSAWGMRSKKGSQMQLHQQDLNGDGLGSRFSSQHRLDTFAMTRQSIKQVSRVQFEKEERYSPNVTINMSDRPDAIAKLVLSLRTLGSFGENTGRGTMSSNVCILLPFVKDVVAEYLSHPSSSVRREAALTCCVLLPPGDILLPNQWSTKKACTRRSEAVSKNTLLPQLLFSRYIGSASGSLIEEVLQKLLRVAVSDPSPLVRLCVVRAFDLRFEPFLCQAHHLPALFLLLQDELLATRAASLQLLGRLARLNPAPILPNLRKMLTELITELRCGGDTGGGRESATRLLVVFLRAEALQRLVHPFLPSIIDALPLKGVAPRLASAALEALGELAQVSRAALIPWVPQLIPHILETMQDQSSASKQRTSLRTLGQIAGGTGYVISPYLDYPQLLPQAADVLPGTKRAPWALRREVIRTFGILGALDPDRFYTVAPKTRKGGGVGGGYFIEHEDENDIVASEKIAASAMSSVTKGMGSKVHATKIDADSAVKSSAVNQVGGPAQSTNVGTQAKGSTFMTSSERQRAQKLLSDTFSKDEDDNSPAHLYMYEQYAMMARPVSNLPPARRLTPSDEDFYPTVALQALTRILKDPSLAVHHGMVMQAIMYIFNSLGLRCVPFLKRVVPHILHTVRTCGQASLRENLLQQVASLSGIVRDHLRPYIPAIFDVVEEFWSSRHLATILTLVSKMAAVPDDFRRYVPRLVRKLLASIENVRVSDWSIPSPFSRNDGVGSPSYEAEKLELILRNTRGLRGILKEYVHLLVPALVKLAESLINQVSNFSGNGNNGLTQAKISNLAVLSVQTLSVLLQTEGGAVFNSTGRMGNLKNITILPSSSSLPARAAQPLMRMLGKETNAVPPRAVGLAIVESLCVCAKQLGRGRWMSFYHIAARDAIISWQNRVGLGSSNMTPAGNGASEGESNQVRSSRPLVGLLLYDEITKELVMSSEVQGRMRLSDFVNIGSDVSAGSALHNSLLRASGQSDNMVSRAECGVFGAEVDEIMPGSVGFDGSSDPLENDMQNSPSIQPILNQTSRHRVSQANLQRAWDVSQRASREDWDEWMRRFGVQLLREAPSPALRATAGLAHAYQPLARELFSAAFVCCWDELTDQYRANLVHSLEVAFFADVNPEILQTLLNLAEFMEHDGVEGGLPIDISVLAELALKCRAYAKALHYKERELSLGGGTDCVEALISINKKLDLPEAALGVLKAAQVELERSRLYFWDSPDTSQNGSGLHHRLSSQFLLNHQSEDMAYSVVAGTDDLATVGGGSWAGVELQESWLAKLGSWSEALAMYERKLNENPNDVGAILGCMRCLDARGEWRRVIELAKRSWFALSGDAKMQRVDRGEKSGQKAGSLYVQSRSHRKAVKFCAQAAWRLGQWEELETYATQLVRGKYDSKSSNLGLLKNPGMSSIGGIRDGGLPRVDFDGAFYSAVLHVHRNEWSLAVDAIDAARRAMDSRFTALMAESYRRAYPSMVTAQTLAEMEEIIAFRKLECRAKAGEALRHSANRADVAEARRQLLSVWRKRLAGCRVDAEVHSSILAVRSLVLGPTEEVDATLTLSALSRQAHCFKLAERVLLDPLAELGADLNGAIFGFNVPSSLGLGLHQFIGGSNSFGAHSGGIDRLVTGDAKAFLPHYGTAHEQYSHELVRVAGGLERLNIQHQLYYAYLKHLWAMDHREEAMSRLARLSDVVDLISHCANIEKNRLRVACWLKLGEWNTEESCTPGSYIPELLQMEVLTAYKRATAADSSMYKAWHAWALFNFRLAQQINEGTFLREETSASTEQRLRSVPSKSLHNHVIAGVKGFVRAISLGTKRWSASVQQDMLNLLTCLFKYGELPEVAATINDGLGSVSIEAWLGVLPQLLARIHIRSPSIRSVLHPLLIRLGAKHPQALMYPLSVLLKSPVTERKVAAESLMNSLKAHSNALVEEALMVSSELIRVAILWLELWHEGLEEASRLYFGEGNVSGMLDVLIPLHEQLEAGAATRLEHDFVKSFGRDLADAHAYLKDYMRLATSNGEIIPTQGGCVAGAVNQYNASGRSVRQNHEAEAALNQAWDLFYQVFRKINKQLPSLTSLELSQCSPALFRAHNLELGVPGSYRVDGSYVKIEKFIPSVQVITSKQRPRKIVLRGSDGKDYVFLLKGHEDLRQDERVMQLFGLVNALLARDRRTNNHDLNIERYAISPLSHNCGVVGWVPHCDTFHSLIRDYRESKKVPLNMENREMMRMAPDYDLLTVMQKVEVFTEALRRTTGNGNDLYEVLWIQSTNSEEWLERRTKFTRSLAVMSMVGYILGLGDRHPSNLMIDQISGRVLHIDFGDCFEVAMHREKYPEKIPFRLTRMLIKAMEVSGIEGSYRSTCERTMGVLRDSRDSLVAMLEAFVYDPLISWRLLDQSSGENSEVIPRYGSANETYSKGEQDSVEVPNKDSRIVKNPPITGRGPEMGGAALARSYGVMNEPIREGQEEDDDEEGSVGRDSGSSSKGDEKQNTGPGVLSQRGIHAPVGGALGGGKENSSGNGTSRSPIAPMHASHARSLQIYSNIQSLAANLSASSRIASISAGGHDRVAAEGSISRSRLDRSVRQREVMSLLGGEDGEAHEEALNEKALKVIRRVQDKLSGTDFHGPDDPGDPLAVPDQVQRLIVQATSSENLCQLFIGWCAFW